MKRLIDTLPAKTGVTKVEEPPEDPLVTRARELLLGEPPPFRKALLNVKEGVKKAVETPARFEAWLRDKDAGEIVGKRCQMSSCPISVFLNDIFPFDRAVQVTRANIDCYVHGARHIAAPEWVAYFVDRVDRSKGSSGSDVSREEALHILRWRPA